MSLRRIDWTQIDSINVPVGNIIDIGNITGPIHSVYAENLFVSGSSVVDVIRQNSVGITGGTYDPQSGTITFTNTTGGTFPISGFVTGMTDTYITGGTLTGGTLVLVDNFGNVINIDGNLTTEFVPLSGGTMRGTLYVPLVSATTIDIGGTSSDNPAVGVIKQNNVTIYHSAGTNNLFFGASSGNFSGITGQNNTAYGGLSLRNITVANNNAVFGSSGLYSNITGNTNTAIGNQAGFSSLGDGNVYLGYQAGYEETGSNKLYISNTSTTTPLIYGDFNDNLVVINNTLSASTISATTLIVGGDTNISGNTVLDGTFSLQDQKFFPHGYNGFSVNEDFDPSNSLNQTAYHFASGNNARDSVVFSLARTGSFTNMFGISGSSSDNKFVIGAETSNTDFEFRTNLGIQPVNLQGGNLIATISRNGDLTANTISATTYYNLPTDIRVTGGTYSNGNTIFTNNTGGTFTVSGFTTVTQGITGLTGSNGLSASTTNNVTTIGFSGGSINNSTNFINGLSANTFSATTYLGLPTDIIVTGSTYSNNTLTFTNNTGGTFNVLFNTMTGLTVSNSFNTSGSTFNIGQTINSGATDGIYSLISGNTVDSATSSRSVRGLDLNIDNLSGTVKSQLIFTNSGTLSNSTALQTPSLFINRVSGSAGFGALYFSDSGTIRAGIRNNTSGLIDIGSFSTGGWIPTFYSNNVEAARFGTTGNFMIGGTSDSGDRLQVTGTSQMTNNTSGQNVLTLSKTRSQTGTSVTERVLRIVNIYSATTTGTTTNQNISLDIINSGTTNNFVNNHSLHINLGGTTTYNNQWGSNTSYKITNFSPTINDTSGTNSNTAILFDFAPTFQLSASVADQYLANFTAIRSTTAFVSGGGGTKYVNNSNGFLSSTSFSSNINNVGHIAYNSSPTINAQLNAQLVGFYHSPTLAGYTPVTYHRAFWNTTGDNYFNSTSGNMGIGTAPNASYKLDIGGTVRVYNPSITGTNTNFTFANTTNSTHVITGGPGGENITFGPSNRIFLNAGQVSLGQFYLTNVGTLETINRGGSAGDALLITGQGSLLGGSGITQNLVRVAGTVAQQLASPVANIFHLNPTLNNSTGTTGTAIIRGIYYNPVVTNLTNTSHIAIQTVSGNNLFGTTSGNTIIGSSTDTNEKLQVSGNTRINGSMVVTTVTGGTIIGLTISGQSTKGGAGYTDFLLVTNTNTGATNPNKYFRLNSTGGIEILNSVYTASTLTLTDNGILNIGGGGIATTSSSDGTSNYLSFNGNGSQIYDDGNLHIHSRSVNQSMWINTNGGGINIGTQSPLSGGSIASSINCGTGSVTGYFNINTGRTFTDSRAYGYLTTSGAGTYPGGSQSVTVSLYATSRIWGQEIDAFSDERMKDIQGEVTLYDGLKLVNNLKPIKYTWKDGEDKGLKVGYSAQQVSKAGFDHLVALMPREGLEETIDDDGFLSPKNTQFSMNYDQVVPYHGVVIKHLLEKIETLEKEINKLKNI